MKEKAEKIQLGVASDLFMVQISCKVTSFFSSKLFVASSS